MAANRWEMDMTGFDQLEKNLRKIPGKGEDVMNRYLHSEGVQESQENIQKKIPISSWKGRARNKRHARNTSALRNQTANLGFTIRPRPRFDYLKYPDLGIGQSKRNKPLEFMYRGLEDSVPRLQQRLEEELIKEIDKTLGG